MPDWRIEGNLRRESSGYVAFVCEREEPLG